MKNAILEEWLPAELEAWKLPEKLTVSEWADKYRILNPYTSAEPGPWHTSRTPYLKGIMDAFNDPFVEEITIESSTQIGKTESIHNMIAYAIDQDPGPTLFVLPREDDAKSISTTRVQPMILLSEELRHHLTDNLDDVSKKEIKLDRMILYFAGSNSPAGLAGKPVKYLFLDETDKYPHFAGKEADPIKLASERTRTFWNRKIVKCSTPTTKDGYIFKEYERSDRRKFYVPCFHCGKYQVLYWGQIKFPQEERNPEKIKEQKLAWFECIGCKNKITDLMKQKMMSQGVWVPEGCEIDKAGKITGEIQNNSRRGFWINALYSPWLSFSDIAAEFLDSRPDPERFMNFVNSWLAEPWEENISGTVEDDLRKLSITSNPRGVVPAGAVVLLAGLDVQKDYFPLVIRAFGPGESWLIRAETVQNWKDVEDVLFNTKYPSEEDPVNKLFEVWMVNVDSGDRTDECYEFCRAWSGRARAIKGVDHLNGMPFMVSTIDKMPSTGLVIPGGMKLWRLDTSYFKDKVNRLVRNTQPGVPGGWHLHSNPADEYVQQFCSEHKVILRDRKTGRAREEWRKKTSHKANHYWDCEIYVTAAAEMLRVFDLRKEGKSVYVPQPKRDDEESNSKGNWLGKKNGWMKRNG